MTGSLAPTLENPGTTTRFIRALSRRVAAAHGETTFAVAAIAVIAVHLLDDNFLHPEEGTSAADHFVSGLVPLAALVAFAAAYRHLRAGLRAAIALPLGVFAIVAGAGEAGYYSLNGGPSGDDYTGLLALAAGFLLVCISATALWRSRRTNDRLDRRYARRLAKTAVAIVAGYIVLFPLALSYVFTHSARAAVPKAKLGAAYENVRFTTSDGLTLRGWYVPSENRAAVIAAPGRAGSQKQARMLIRHGYGVLLFDRRGEGESEGDPNAFGWAADKDMNAAVAFLRQRPDVDRNRIGGIGLSVGGETLLQTAAESDSLKAVVADGAGARSLREDLARTGSKKWVEIPTSLVITAGTMLFANQPPPPNLKSLVGRIAPRPVFFIYGQYDQDNVRELTPGYYATAGKPKAIWEVAGAAHTGGIDAQPREYEQRVTRLLRPRTPRQVTPGADRSRVPSRVAPGLAGCWRVTGTLGTAAPTSSSMRLGRSSVNGFGRKRPGLTPTSTQVYAGLGRSLSRVYVDSEAFARPLPPCAHPVQPGRRRPGTRTSAPDDVPPCGPAVGISFENMAICRAFKWAHLGSNQCPATNTIRSLSHNPHICRDYSDSRSGPDPLRPTIPTVRVGWVWERQPS